MDKQHLGKDRHLVDILKKPKLNKNQARKEALYKKVTAGTGKILSKEEQKFKQKHYFN